MLEPFAWCHCRRNDAAPTRPRGARRNPTRPWTRTRARALGDQLGVDWDEVDLGQFRRGLVVEGEHRDVTHGAHKTTAKIVLAHLREKRDYYTRLKRVEGR